MISNEHDSNGEPKGEVTSSSFPLRHPYKGIEGIRGYAVTRDQLKGMLKHEGIQNYSKTYTGRI